MVNYQLGKIYTVRSLTSPEIYVGSTCMILCKRMALHRNNWKNNTVLGKNKDIVKDINEWYIELYENYPCEKIEELTQREGEIIREIGTLNKNIAGRTKKEYYTDNQDKIKQQTKEYYTDNQDKIKQYRTDNKEKIKQYSTDNKEKIQQYRTDNKEKIKQQANQYCKDNKEKRKQYCTDNKEKIKEQKKQYYLKQKLAKSQ